MARRTNGSGGKPSDSEIPSPAASASNVVRLLARSSPQMQELRTQVLLPLLAALDSGRISPAHCEYLTTVLADALADLFPDLLLNISQQPWQM